MKAIETRYKGYRFRSRLEARWAVFFDELRIDYTYETEGWHIPSGCYLPDFHLRNADLWVEIKPSAATQQEIEKCRELAHEKSVLLVCGQPWPDAYSITYFYPPGDRITGDDRESGLVFGMSRYCDSFAVLNAGGAAQIFCHNPACKCHGKYPIADDARLTRAYEKARGARF